MKHAAWLGTCGLVVCLLLSGKASGDGGTVRLKDSTGPFVVTIFTAPEPLRVGVADLSVLVQGRDNGEPILDAQVSIRLSLPASSVGVGETIAVQATHAQAINKLLYAAAIDLPAAGKATLRVDVRRGAEVTVSCALPIAPGPPPFAAVWKYLVMPPAVILVFVLHQWLVRR
jgi:hypothetical protein